MDPVVYPFVPSPYHQELYEATDPLNYADPDIGFHWFKYCGAIASMFDQIDGYARDQDDGTPGWGILLDVDRCPSEALPWFGQFVGVQVNLALSDVQQRNQIKNVDGFKRGTIGSMVAAAQQHLTGSQTVYVRERDPSASSVLGGAYGLTILTLISETSDPTLVQKSILAKKPAGIILNYATVPGGLTYLTLRTNYATYDSVRTAFATYNGLRNNLPGT